MTPVKFSILHPTNTETDMKRNKRVQFPFVSTSKLSLEAERTGVAAAREDLATTRERLRRSQEEDLVNASQRLCLATDDLEAAKREIAALTAAEEEHARELAEERDERRQMEQNAVAAAMAAEEREKVGSARTFVGCGLWFARRSRGLLSTPYS